MLDSHAIHAHPALRRLIRRTMRPPRRVPDALAFESEDIGQELRSRQQGNIRERNRLRVAQRTVNGTGHSLRARATTGVGHRLLEDGTAAIAEGRRHHGGFP